MSTEKKCDIILVGDLGSLDLKAIIINHNSISNTFTRSTLYVYNNYAIQLSVGGNNKIFPIV